MNIGFEWTLGEYAAVDVALLEECAALFSKHYGTWSSCHPETCLRSRNVRLSPERIAELLRADGALIYCARYEGKLVGYAIAIIVPQSKTKKIAWTTQLVVSQNFRRNRIAQRLLHGVCNEVEKCTAWGLISANPYAIRALERATQRRCDPGRIKRNIAVIRRLGAVGVPYVNAGCELSITSKCAAINTEFFVDHVDVEVMLKYVSVSTPWLLGTLMEGWEWLGFTFESQKTFTDEVQGVNDEREL